MKYSKFSIQFTAIATAAVLTMGALSSPEVRAGDFTEALKGSAALVGTRLVASGVTVCMRGQDFVTAGTQSHVWTNAMHLTFFCGYIVYQYGEDIYKRVWAVDPDDGREVPVEGSVVVYSGVNIPEVAYTKIVQGYKNDGGNPPLPSTNPGKTCLNNVKILVEKGQYQLLDLEESAFQYCKQAASLVKQLAIQEAALKAAQEDEEENEVEVAVVSRRKREAEKRPKRADQAKKAKQKKRNK